MSYCHKLLIPKAVKPCLEEHMDSSHHLSWYVGVATRSTSPSGVKGLKFGGINMLLLHWIEGFNHHNYDCVEVAKWINS